MIHWLAAASEVGVTIPVKVAGIRIREDLEAHMLLAVEKLPIRSGATRHGIRQIIAVRSGVLASLPRQLLLRRRRPQRCYRAFPGLVR